MEITNELLDELKVHAEKTAAYVKSKLPKDWNLEHKEILSEVYWTFLTLMTKYKESSVSPVSWCCIYGGKATLKRLYDEYHRLKNQDTLYAIGELDDGDDDDVVKRQVSNGVFKGSKDLATQLEKRDEVSRIIDCASLLDKEIMKLIMEGFSYGEIAEKVGISKGEISKRMKKHANAG